jgi:hypothetical protein
MINQRHHSFPAEGTTVVTVLITNRSVRCYREDEDKTAYAVAATPTRRHCRRTQVARGLLKPERRK